MTRKEKLEAMAQAKENKEQALKMYQKDRYDEVTTYFRKNKDRVAELLDTIELCHKAGVAVPNKFYKHFRACYSNIQYMNGDSNYFFKSDGRITRLGSDFSEWPMHVEVFNPNEAEHIEAEFDEFEKAFNKAIDELLG